MFWTAFCIAWFGFLHANEFTSPLSGFDPAVHLSLNDVAVDCHLHPSAVFIAIKASKTNPFHKRVQIYLRSALTASSVQYPASPTSSVTRVISQALCASSRMLLPSHTAT